MRAFSVLFALAATLAFAAPTVERDSSSLHATPKEARDMKREAPALPDDYPLFGGKREAPALPDDYPLFGGKRGAAEIPDGDPMCCKF